MTDEPSIDPEIAKDLTDLENSLRRMHASMRRSLLFTIFSVAALALADIAVVVRAGGPWVVRDMAMIGELTALVLLACYGGARTHQVSVDLARDFTKSLHKRAELIDYAETASILLTTINEAHARGAAAVFPPPANGEAPLPNPRLH
jgi:hypothetical protein